MKTIDIMQVLEYEAVGGPIKAIPVSDVAKFVQRIRDRVDDIEDGVSVSTLGEELNQVLVKLNQL